MIFSLLAVRDVSLEFYTVSSPPPSRTMAMLVRGARQNVFDDDEVRHVERRKEEVCRWRTMLVYFCFLGRLHLSVTSSFEGFFSAASHLGRDTAIDLSR